MSFIVPPKRLLEPKKGDWCPGAVAAHQFGPDERMELAMEALRRSQPITELAAQQKVSRKFVYQQLERAATAVDKAFHPPESIPKFLGWLPVTADWMERVVVSSSLECHGSIRGIRAHVESITGVKISEGKVCDILATAILRAIGINEQHDLSRIRDGAHDEIFSQDTPVLVGVDPHSFYTYLMEPSCSRGEVAWGVAVLEKAQKQGLALKTSVQDAARGIRAGLTAAFPQIHMQGDVLHALMEVTELVSYLEGRAYAKLRKEQEQEKTMQRAKKRGQGNHHSKALAVSRKEARKAILLYEDFQILSRWFKETLDLVGPDLNSRRWIYDFVVAEMKARSDQSHRIKPVVTYLIKQRDDLLAFVPKIYEGLEHVAAKHGLLLPVVELVYRQNGIPIEDPRYWKNQGEILRQAGSQATQLSEDVQRLLDKIVRASSAVENINSILRGYFFLRKTIGVDFLELLRFYLNHRRFRRSAKPERVGRSPYETMTGQKHPHWLELLGYTPVSLCQ